MKKALSLTLALTLAASLAAPALAVERPEGWTPADGARVGEPAPSVSHDSDDAPLLIAPNPIAVEPISADLPEAVDVPLAAQYAATIVMDGETVDLSNIPGAPAGYVPMRALCEANGGSAEWYAEDSQSLFFFDENSIIVDFKEMSVKVGAGSDALEGIAPYLDPAGYTFLPVSVLDGLETVSVNSNPELDVERYDITTSASDPTVKLVKSILEAVESAARMKHTPAEMEEYLGIRQENFTEIVGYFPMMINADTVVVGKVAEGKLDSAKEDLEARKQTTIQNFEHYLQGPYEMAQKGQIVVAPDGEHIMLIISGDNDKAIELFNAAYPQK